MRKQFSFVKRLMSKQILTRCHHTTLPFRAMFFVIVTLSFTGITQPATAQNRRDDRIDDHFTQRLIWRNRRPGNPEDRGSGNVKVLRFHSFNGASNNLFHFRWGTAGSNLYRKVPQQYADRISEPARADQPSARAISNAICDQPGSIPNSMGLTDMVWQWGQFVDHDLDLTETDEIVDLFPIQVPAGDTWFDPQGSGSQMIILLRSAYNHNTGIVTPRQQTNFITSWLDGSQIYGSDEATADSLRRSTKGMLRVSQNSTGHLLPVDDDGFFLAGDIRANEQVGLTAMHTLFVREHNRLCREMLKRNPNLTNDQLYYNARAKVIATLQVITYEEFLPAILGPKPLPRYPGYRSHVFPNITNTFSTAAYRFGHTMLSSQLQRLDASGNPIAAGPLDLADAFFNPAEIREHGIDPYLMGLANQQAQEIDGKLVDDVRNFLFGAPGSGGFDLAALNIQRGRDHGLADINTIRIYYGLPRYTDFNELTSDTEVQTQLRDLYGEVENVDPWVAMLCEDHFPGAAVGETAWFVIREQFSRLRNGDRFWYENQFSGEALQNISQTRLSDIIRRNTTLRTIRDDVFHLF